MGSVKAVVLASGTGLRFQDKQPKQFMKLAGLPVIVHTMNVFQKSSDIDEIVVVCHADYVDYVWELVAQHGLSKVEKVVAGGETRQESSRIGIECCGEETDYVLLHDSVRPFLPQKVVGELVEAVKAHGAVDTVIASSDTLVEVDPEGFITHIPDRSMFRRGQTPQAFARSLVLNAHRDAIANQIENATDDCQLVMRLGHKVFCVPGDEQNIKITYPIDMHLADKLFQLRQEVAGAIDDQVIEALREKVVVVIGGTEGIGLALCEQLKNIGSMVVPLSRRSTPPLDVAKLSSVEEGFQRVVKQFGRIDHVVNCAGDLSRKNVEFMSAQEWRDVWSVNMDGCFYVAKAAIGYLRESNGSLLYVGSSSYTRGRGGYAAYSSSKAALVNFVQALAEELSRDQIRVNVVSPGRVHTAMRTRNFGQEPLESLLDPQDVAVEMVRALAMETSGSVFEVR